MARIQHRLVDADYSATAMHAAKVRDEAKTSQLNYITHLLPLASERQFKFFNLLSASEVPVIEPRDSPSDLLSSAGRLAAESDYVQSGHHATKAIQLYEQWIEEWNQIPDSGDLPINSLGMRFQPIEGLWVSVWETRVYEIAVFVQESGHDPMRLWITWDPTQGITHRVRSVKRYDAKIMYQWLTERERNLGRLGDGEAYRLPTDLDWSSFAGLPPEDVGFRIIIARKMHE